MANTMDKLAKELKNAMTASDERKPKPYDAQAEVLRVEDGVAWVHIPGGVEETPVRLTINAKKGDMVNIHVANGSAWITGNGTNPPTDDSTANYAVDLSTNIQKDVVVLNTVVAEEIEATNARFTNVEADTAKIHDLTADQLTASVGYIADLTADHITASDISADHATVGSLNTNYAHITNGTIDNAKIGYADVDGLNANYAHITNGVIDNAKIGVADVNNLSANYAQIDAANVTDLSAQNAWVNKLMVQTGLIASREDVFYLNAIKIDAANITAGTIDVEHLIVTVNGQKYLIHVNPSTGQPTYEKLDGNIVEPRTITADKIVAHDITVQEITTENLVGTNGWINLNLGRFFYGNGANYASSTNAIDWNGTTLKIKGDIGDSVIFNSYSTTTEMNTAIGNAVDGIEVGGRNLIRNTKKMEKWTVAARATITTSEEYAYVTLAGSSADWNSVFNALPTLSLDMLNGTEMVLSFEYKASADWQTSNIVCAGTSLSAGSTTGLTRTKFTSLIPSAKLLPATNTWTKAYFPCRSLTPSMLTSGSGDVNSWYFQIYNYNNNLTVNLRKIKLEYGNKATDWTPAPEDVQAEIDSIQVGGRNLFKNSKELTAGWSKENGSVSDGVATITCVNSGTARLLQAPSNGYWAWQTNQDYMISVDAKASANGLMFHFHAVGLDKSSNDIALTTDWKRYTWMTSAASVSSENGSVSFFAKNGQSGTIQFRCPKMELGNKATDWSLAPEDAQDAEQRIYYRSNSTTAPTAPSTWVTSTATANTTWTTKRMQYDRTYKYLYTCIQRKTVGGTITNTSVLLDDTTTVIDGGNIITGTVAANSIDANSGTFNTANIPNLNADKINAGTIDVARIPDGALNSNVQVGGRNILLGTERSITWISDQASGGFKVKDLYRTYLPVNVLFKAGDLVTLSFDWSTNATGGNFHLECGNVEPWTWGTVINASGTRGATSPFVDVSASNKSGHCVITYSVNAAQASAADQFQWFRIRTDGDDFIGKTITISNAKGEIGNKATDWSPAPEDSPKANMTPFFSFTPYNTTENTGALYWNSFSQGASPTKVGTDGFIRLSYNNTGTSTVYLQHRPKAIPTLKPETMYTLMIEFGAVTKSGDAYLRCPDGGQGSTNAAYIRDNGIAGTLDTPIVANTTVYKYFMSAPTTASNYGVYFGCCTRVDPSSSVTYEVRLSLYEGLYAGPYVTPYNKTVIDGGQIMTGTITANQIAANAITIGDMDTATATKVNNGDSALTKVNYYNRACQVGNSGNTQTAYWRKFASYTETGTYQDAYIIFDVSNNGDFGVNKRFGRLKAHLRTEGTAGNVLANNLKLEWITRGEGIALENFVLAYKATSGTDVKVELWAYCSDSYSGYRFGMVEEGKRASIQTTTLWTLYDSWTPNGSASITSGYTQVVSTDIDVARTTATNYLYADSNGLRIASANPSTQNQRVHLTSSDIKMYDANGTQRLFLNAGSGVIIGRTDKGHTTVKDDGLHVWINSESTPTNEVAFYGSTARIGKPTDANTGNVYIDDNSVDIRKGATVLSTFTASGAELGKNSNTAIINMCNNAFKINGQYEQFISANDTFAVNIKNNASTAYRKVEIGAGDESCITFFEQPSDQYKSPITNIYAGGGLLGKSACISMALDTYDMGTPEIYLTSEVAVEANTPRLQITESIYSSSGSLYYMYSAPKTGSQTYNAVWTKVEENSNNNYRLGRPSSSSRRYKEDIKPVENDELDPHRLYDIPVMQFKYKEGYFPQDDEYENNRIDVVGFIAEDVLEHYPQAAIIIDEEVDNWNERYIIPPMLKLIQEQNDRITELERRLS